MDSRRVKCPLSNKNEDDAQNGSYALPGIDGEAYNAQRGKYDQIERRTRAAPIASSPGERRTTRAESSRDPRDAARRSAQVYRTSGTVGRGAVEG